MAESYRGLTVRIGADTSSLQKALTGINHAVNATQSQLTRIQRALRGLDDTSGAAAQAHQLELVGQAAQEVSTRLSSLRRAYDEVGRQTVSVGDLTGSMSDVSETIGDAAARTGQLRDQLNGITAELKQTYEAIRTSEGTLGADLADDRIVKSVDAINQAMKETGREYREFTKESVNADAVVDEFARLGLVTQETAEHVHTLRQRYNDLSAEREQMRQVESFQDLGVKIAEDTALLERLQSKMRELQSVSTVARGLDTQAEELRVISTAADAAAQRFRELDAAAKLDPSNTALAEERTQALAEATHLAAERAEVLKQRMAEYASAGIDKAASETESVAQRLATAESNAAKFTSQLQEAVGRAQSISDEMAVIEARDDGLGEGAEKAAEDYKKLETQLEQVNAEIAELRPKAQAALEELDTAKACSELQQLQTEMREAEAASHGLGNTTKSAFGDGVSVIIDISQYARQAAGYIVRASEEIDGAYRDMRKTVNGTEADFEHLRQAAMDYSQTHFTSADTILEMEAMGGQLGIATDKLEQFATTASNLDIATNIDADTIAQQMGQLANIMDDLNEDNLDSYADALVRLGNNMPALENDIAEITTRIAAQSNIIGLSTPEVLGWSAAIASTGQKSEAAGTAFSKTMSQIEAAVGGGTTAIADLAEATDQSVDDVLRIVSEGGPAFEDLAAAAGTSTDEIAASMENGKGKLEDFARVARMSAEDFARMWRESPSDALKAFIEGLKAVQDAGGSMDNTLAELGITATRQKQGLEGLTQTTDKLNDALQMSGDAWNGVSDQWGDAGDAAREAERKSEGFSGTLQELSNNAQVLAASFGEGMVPLMEGLSGAVGGLADAFQAMPPAVSTTVASLGALVTAISLVYPVFRGLKHSWGEITGFFNGIPGVAKTTGALKEFGATLGAVTGLGGAAVPVLGGIAIAVTALGTAAWEEQQKVVRLKQAVDDMSVSSYNLNDALNNASATLNGMGGGTLMTRDEVLSYVEGLAESAKKTQESMNKAGESVAMLEMAKNTIKEMAGNSQLNAEQQGRLKVALDTVNQALGTNISLEDATTGAYQDQNSEIRKVIDSLDDLIKKKQDEVKINALTQGAEDAYKNKLDAEKKYIEQRKEVDRMEAELNQKREEYEAKRDSGKYSKQHIHELWEQINYAEVELNRAKTNLDALKGTMDQSNQAWASYTAALGDAQVASSEMATEMQKLMLLNDSGNFSVLTESLHDSGRSVADLANQLTTLGVSTEQVSALSAEQLNMLASSYDGTFSSVVGWLGQVGVGYDDIAAKTQVFIENFQQLPEQQRAAFDQAAGGVEGFIAKLGEANLSVQDLSNKGISAEMVMQWAQQCNWDIDSVIQRIKDYNGTPMETQTAEVETDKAEEKVGTLADDLRTKLDGKTYSAKATLSASGTSEVLNATGAMKDFGLLPTTTQKKAEAKANGQDLVDKLREAFEKYSQVEEPTKTATAEAYGEDGVWGLNSAIDAFDAQPGYVSKTRETFVVTTTKSAAGGIRMHAEGGYIATGPTFMTPRDLVGEAGAEAIVPLTNRRYSGAFARVIAEEIGKLGAQSQSVVLNPTFIVNGNDNPERFARQSMRSMMQLARAEG